ncbi:MAG: cation:proton antiporter [Solirubrobacteraceae bacterium]
MTSGQVILDVAVILVAARIGAALFESLGQPGVIGEIVAGITLGPTILGALPGDPSAGLFPPEALEVLKGIGQLGLALFMFQIGWELDLGLVRRRERAAMLISLASVVVPFTLGIGLATYLHPRYAEDVPFWPFALFVGAALSLTAFPVLARLLAQLGLSQTPTGSLVLSAAAVDDILGWTALAIALAALSSGGPWDYARIVVETAILVAVVVVLLRPLFARLTHSTSPLQQGLVVPLVLGTAYATEAIGIHFVFGAFLAGAVMPRIEQEAAARNTRQAIVAAAALLVPVYFVNSGMAVDIPGLEAGDAGVFLLILGAACVGKFAGAFAGGRAAGVRGREAVAIGVLMNTRGLIEIVLLTVGRDAGLIDDRLFTLFALMAIVTTLATAPILRRTALPAASPAASAA